MSLLDEFKAELAERNVTYREMESVEDCIADADVIYMEPVVQADYTKSRDEGGEDKGLTPAAYQVTRDLMRAQAKRDSIILALRYIVWVTKGDGVGSLPALR